VTYRDVLRIVPFRRLWLGQAISLLGDSFYFVIFMFMVKKITGDNASVGYVGAFQTLPYLLFSAYAGAVADRLDRRLLMLASDILSGATLLVFAVIVWQDASPPVESIYAVSFVLSSFRVFFVPAKNASVPNLVPATHLLTANSLSAATQNLAPMLSLSLSATVLAAIYEVSPQLFFLSAVLLNAFSFFLSAVFVWLLPKLIPDRTSESHPWRDIADGLRYIRSRRALVVLLSTQCSMSLLISPFFVAYVAANEAWFDGKPATLAWFECAFFVGMVLSSLFVGKLAIRRAGVSFVWAITTIGLAVIAMAFAPYKVPFLLLQVVCGLALPFAEIPVATYMQATTPDSFRGRVNSVSNMLQVGVMPVGYALGGLMVAEWGLVIAFVAMGAGMGLSALAGLLDREFRRSRIPEALPPQ
jgi:MFS family permease